MRQRAALLRTVVQEREMLLLDEPFGALDALTRTGMQRWLETMWERHRWTALLITHDVREAVFLSDRIYVLCRAPPACCAKSPYLFRARACRISASPEASAIEADILDTLLTHSPPKGHEPCLP